MEYLIQGKTWGLNLWPLFFLKWNHEKRTKKKLTRDTIIHLFPTLNSNEVWIKINKINSLLKNILNAADYIYLYSSIITGRKYQCHCHCRLVEIWFKFKDNINILIENIYWCCVINIILEQSHRKMWVFKIEKFMHI